MSTTVLHSSTKKLKTQVVEELPEIGKTGVIYLKENGMDNEDNKYDEYIFIKDTNKFELLGLSEAKACNNCGWENL